LKKEFNFLSIIYKLREIKKNKEKLIPFLLQINIVKEVNLNNLKILKNNIMRI
jgi:hypothetical protein